MMKLHTKPLLLSILATSVFMVLAAPTYANYAVDVVFGWLGGFHDNQLQVMYRTWVILGVVIILEALFFWRMMGISFWRALLASLVVNVLSTFAGFLWVRMSMNSADASSAYFFGFLVALVSFIILSILKCPIWYWATAIAVLIPGLMINHAIAGVFPPLSHLAFFFYLLAPLVYCLAMTLLLEGLFIRIFIKRDDVWKWLFVVNLISYLFLAILAPFFATNPFKVHPAYNWSPGSSYYDRTFIELARAQRATNLYLLGLSDNPNPSGSYDGEFESIIVHDSSLQSSDLKLLDELVLDVLSVPNLDESMRTFFQNHHEYLTHWFNVQNAIDNGSQDQLDFAYGELEECSNNASRNRTHLMNINATAWFIVNQMNDASSELTPPVPALDNYNAIQAAFSNPLLNRNPDYAINAIDTPQTGSDSFVEAGSSEDAANRAMHDSRPYFVFWSRARQAIADSDSDRLQETFDSWQEWRREIAPDNRLLLDLPDPANVITALLEVNHSDLVVEGLDE